MNEAKVCSLLQKSQAGDRLAREAMVQDNMGLVWSIARRFSNRGYDLEDLFQVGSIGLMKAIDNFDLSYSVKFSTYAVPMITGEIRRFLRDDGMIKVSRSLKENGAKTKQARKAAGGAWQRTKSSGNFRRNRASQRRNCYGAGGEWRGGIDLPDGRLGGREGDLPCRPPGPRKGQP